jgi:hypothetical protein
MARVPVDGKFALAMTMNMLAVQWKIPMGHQDTAISPAGAVKSS